MAGSLNRVTIIGNLGRDPEIRNLNNGGRVANMRIATSETWRDKQTGERQERTEWHSIVIWSEGLIGVVEKYLKKGSKIYVEGQLQTRKWQDQNGIDRYSTEVVVKGFDGKIVMLGGRGDNSQQGQHDQGGYDQGNQGGQATQGGQSGRTLSEEIDDEIPF